MKPAINNAKSTLGNDITIDKQLMIDNEQPNNEEQVIVEDPASVAPDNAKGSYEGRKYDSEIDGPQQKSQETDEIYSDPRKEENLPDGGKNVGDLNAYDLSQDGNKI
ncbi:hypothetical protein [Psychrobacter sp. TAE2020]|uniref:hypothetical protein n=1 Tax=Psychrobacter sp. TAE2020 TaxID=2846762 RepID=UPI001E3A674D|nr:hypothetical protein [Psychrobacter sp. TAE2020]